MEGGDTKKPGGNTGNDALWMRGEEREYLRRVPDVEKPSGRLAICHGCQKPLTREHRAFRRLAVAVVAAVVAALMPAPSAAASPVVITEIAAFEKSDHEWIEVVNRSDAPVDLTGWKFFEDGTNHGITLARGGDAVLEPGEFAIIADVAANFIIDYPAFTGTLFDSSWSTLSLDGEAIALRDKTGAIIESFTYLPATDGSLERADINLDDYTAANWIENRGGATPGTGVTPDEPVSQTSRQVVETEQLTEPDDPTTAPDIGTASDVLEEPASESNGQQTLSNPPADDASAAEESTAAHPAAPGDVVINEFVSDPANGGREWIELWNRGDRELDLHWWKIEDGTGVIKTLEQVIGAGSPVVVELSASKLNNAGDLILLRDDLGTLIDAVAYGSWDDGNAGDNAPAPGDGESGGRHPNAADTDRDGADFAVLETPTPGSANAPPRSPPAPSSQASSDPAAPTTAVAPAPAPRVVISELYPNPPDGDEKEWVEIGNIGAAPADLGGWTLSDGVTTFRFVTQTINSGSFVVLPRSVTHISLANSGFERVTMRDESGKIVSRAGYRGAPEMLSYALDDGGEWQWTRMITPGALNLIDPPNAPPVPAVEAPREAKTGELILFDATDSADPEGGTLSYRWDFGDGSFGDFARMLHAFGSPGRNRATLTVSDSDGGTATKTVTVVVTLSGVAVSSRSEKEQTSPGKKLRPETAARTTVRRASRPRNGRTSASATGIITALPGVMNIRSFLIETADGPTEIFLHSKLFPPLAPGDRVSASGRWSDREGIRRLIVSDPAAIRVTGHTKAADPRPLRIADISPEDAGRVISVSGEVVEMTRQGASVDDGTGEALVTRPPGGWPSDLAVGARASVSGVALATRQGFKLLPREASDIRTESPPPVPAPDARARPPPTRSAPWAGLPIVGAVFAVSAGSAALLKLRPTKKQKVTSLT